MRKKLMIVTLILAVCGGIGASYVLSSASDAEMPECAIGSSDDSECVLSPTDCTRGIDEANQSSCQE